MDTSRFTQFGSWEGHISVGGVRRDVAAARTLGTRDRSWGVRPVGEPPGGASSQERAMPGVYWVWSPIHFLVLPVAIFSAICSGLPVAIASSTAAFLAASSFSTDCGPWACARRASV